MVCENIYSSDNLLNILIFFLKTLKNLLKNSFYILKISYFSSFFFCSNETLPTCNGCCQLQYIKCIVCCLVNTSTDNSSSIICYYCYFISLKLSYFYLHFSYFLKLFVPYIYNSKHFYYLLLFLLISSPNPLVLFLQLHHQL